MAYKILKNFENDGKKYLQDHIVELIPGKIFTVLIQNKFIERVEIVDLLKAENINASIKPSTKLKKATQETNNDG
mgnify:FL=1